MLVLTSFTMQMTPGLAVTYETATALREGV
eukprot:SAG11_NODE_31635_length_290_cov_0.874346_1_plen_29_part_10